MASHLFCFLVHKNKKNRFIGTFEKLQNSNFFYYDKKLDLFFE